MTLRARLLVPLVVTTLGCASQPPAPLATPPGPLATPPVNPTPAAAPAPEPAPPAVRPAAAILADAVAAIGGEAAWNAHASMRVKLELTFQGQRISGTADRISARGDKGKGDRMLLTTDIPGVGTFREGSNGSVAWTEDPINGLRVLSAAEAEQARADAAWCAELRIPDLYKTIESKNEPGPGGAMLECLVLTPKEGNPLTSCYDTKTHLQVLLKGTHTTPQGDSPFLSAVRDWMDVGGLKMPRTFDTQEGPLTFTMRVSEAKLDEPVDDKMFEQPTPPAPAKAGGKGAAKPKAKAPAKK